MVVTIRVVEGYIYKAAALKLLGGFLAASRLSLGGNYSGVENTDQPKP